MGVARAGLEPGAHARSQWRLTGVCDEHRLTLDDVDELVFAQMRVAQRRHSARGQARQVDPEIGQAEHIAERPPLPSRHPRREWFGVAAGALRQRHLKGGYCSGLAFGWHCLLLLAGIERIMLTLRWRAGARLRR